MSLRDGGAYQLPRPYRSTLACLGGLTLPIAPHDNQPLRMSLVCSMSRMELSSCSMACFTSSRVSVRKFPPARHGPAIVSVTHHSNPILPAVRPR